MVIIRDLVVSGGSSELIDALTTKQAQYERLSKTPAEQQLQSLQMEEDVPPAGTGGTPAPKRDPGLLEPGISPEGEAAYKSYRDALRQITQPGGPESLTPEQKQAAIAIAEEKL